MSRRRGPSARCSTTSSRTDPFWRLDVITHHEVAAHWREHYPESLGISTPKMVEGHVICFFQMCQAAALGTHVIGKKGQPTRLRLDRDEPPPRAKTSSACEAPEACLSNLHETATGERRGEATPILARSASKTRVFISHGGEAEFADRIRVTLDLADIEGRVVERTDTDAPLVSTDTAHVMRQCETAVIIVSGDDCSKNGADERQLDPSLLVVIGAAAVLYEGRVLLVWEKLMPTSVKLRDVSYCTHEGCEMTWETGVEIIKAVKGFKSTAR